MNLVLRKLQAWLGIAALVAAASCSDAPGTSPVKAAVTPRSGLLGLTSPTLMACPSDTTLSTSSIITPLGGVLSIGGTSVLFPQGAVLSNTPFTLTIPASQYLEIDVTANEGQSFLFSQPITVTIDYSRCAPSIINLGPRSVWYIDLTTNALLQNMAGVDDPLLDQITFTTLHLSGYAVAN